MSRIINKFPSKKDKEKGLDVLLKSFEAGAKETDSFIQKAQVDGEKSKGFVKRVFAFKKSNIENLKRVIAKINYETGEKINQDAALNLLIEEGAKRLL